MPSTEFEPEIPVIGRLQNYALDPKVTAIGYAEN
jgi:hypothetical protein